MARRVRAVLADAANADATDPWLVYRPHPTRPTSDRQQASLGPVITGLLKSAGVHQPRVTRAESIREWLAARVFAATGSLEAVAVRLGMASLDTAAHVESGKQKCRSPLMAPTDIDISPGHIHTC